ncbi:MAG TPA: hypothetical protein VJA21_13260 [Verrucomicrobiae bacterium]
MLRPWVPHNERKKSTLLFHNLNALLIATLFLCSSSVILAQGRVVFRNFLPLTTPPIDAPVYLDYVGGTPLSGANPNYRAALLGGPSTALPWGLTQAGMLQMSYSPINTTLTWVGFQSGTLPGQSPGYIRVGTESERVIPGADWGTLALVQMVAWEGPYTSWIDAWEAAQGGSVRIGVSNPLTLQLAQSPAGLHPDLWGLQPFAIQFVPEPSTAALTVISVAVFILGRSRWRRSPRR